MRGKKQSAVQNKAISAEEAATLLTHVRELQIRLLVTAAVLVGAGVVAYLYYPQIIEILRKPLNAPLIISSVSGSFSFVMKICLIAGIAVSVPLIVYNFIMFVRPAFIEVFTRKRVFLMTAGSVLAAAGGTLFGYFFIIPGAIHFFTGFHVSGVNTMIQADGYLNFVTNVIVTFVLMFQLPIIVSLIDRIVPISPRAMLKGEKWALVGSIVISLVVPFAMDIMTQVLIAAPIFLLYNISFVVVAFQHRYTRRVQRKADKVEAKVVRKSEKAAARPVRTAQAIPTAAHAVIQPHPQLAEVFALQESLPLSSVVPKAQAKALIVRRTVPSAPPLPAVSLHKAVSKPVAFSRVRPVAISMDGMTSSPTPAPQPVVINRAQPTHVIRQATTLRAPVRNIQSTPLRSLNLMADIR